MTHDELEPMDPEFAALLATEKVVAEPAAALKERVLARVVASIGAPPGGGGGGGGGTSRGAASRLVSAHPLAMLASTFALGFAAGAAAVYGSSRAGEGRAARIAIASLPRVASTSAPAATAASANTAPPETSAQSEAARPAPSRSPDSRGLAAERTLLDVARAALSRGEAANAIAAAERHAAEFPDGQLAEEREAILIRALVQSGSMESARARARRFHARFPQSIFDRTIDAATASIP
jgi:hypothetical protein